MTKSENKKPETKEDVSTEENKPSRKKRGLKVDKALLKTLGFALLGLLAVFLVTFGILIYGTKNESPIVRGVGKVLPFPNTIVNSKVVWMGEYYKQLEILNNYYVNFKKIDFNTEEGKEQQNQIRRDVSERVTEDALIAREAKKLKVTLTKDELENSYNELVKSNGGIKAFSEILNNFYGLSVDEFKVTIYRPRVLREKLAEKINSEESVTGAAKAKAEEVLAKVKAGEDFAKLSKEYSQDPGSAANGGDLGFFGKGKMVPEFEDAALKLKKGETSELVRSVYGYHIIRVTDTRGEEVRASHILIKVQDFDEWLKEKKEALAKEKVL